MEHVEHFWGKMRKVPIVRDCIAANKSFLLPNSTCSMENVVGKKYLEHVGMFLFLFLFYFVFVFVFVLFLFLFLFFFPEAPLKDPMHQQSIK